MNKILDAELMTKFFGDAYLSESDSFQMEENGTVPVKKAIDEATKMEKNSFRVDGINGTELVKKRINENLKMGKLSFPLYRPESKGTSAATSKKEIDNLPLERIPDYHRGDGETLEHFLNENHAAIYLKSALDSGLTDEREIIEVCIKGYMEQCKGSRFYNLPEVKHERDRVLAVLKAALME